MKKIKLIITMLCLGVLLTACGDIMEKVDSAKDVVEGANELISTVKEEIDTEELTKMVEEATEVLSEVAVVEESDETLDGDLVSESDGDGQESVSGTQKNEASEHSQNEAVSDVNGDSPIIIRKEIGEYDLEEFKEDLMNLAYTENMMVSTTGTSVDSETGTNQIASDMYFSGENTRVDTFLDGQHVSTAIYNVDKNKTCIYNPDFPAYKEITSGNQVPFRLLDYDMLMGLLEDDEVSTQYIEQEDGSRYIWIGVEHANFMYSVDNRLMMWFKEKWSDSEGDYEHQWFVINVVHDADIGQEQFIW